MMSLSRFKNLETLARTTLAPLRMQGCISITDLHAHYFFVYCQKESVLNRPEDMEVDNAFQTGEIDTETSGRLKRLFECLTVIYLESRVTNARMTETCFHVVLIQFCHDTESSLEVLAH